MITHTEKTTLTRRGTYLQIALPILASLVLTATSLLSWLDGRVNPLADRTDNFGQSMLHLPIPVVNGSFLAAATAMLLAAVALGSPPGSWLRDRVRILVPLAAVAAFLLLDHTLLMVAGYFPMIVIRLGMGRTEGLEDLLSPGVWIQLLIAAGCISLLLRREAVSPNRKDLGGDLDEITRRTRFWTKIAIEAPLAYALTRVLMFLKVPGFTSPEFDRTLLLAGLGLAVASVGGAILTLGLIASWGERFPRWCIGLAGRDVPIRLAVIPALIVAAMVMAASRSILLEAVSSDAKSIEAFLDRPLLVLPQLLWPLWSYALAMAALSYRRRRMIAPISLGKA